MKTKAILILLLFVLSYSLYSQKKTDANIFGHVISGEEHLPFVSIAVKGTTIGTATDQTGHYRLINVPLGRITIVASYLGYKTQEIILIAEADRLHEVNFDLEPDYLGLDEVVVSASRETRKRSESSFIVNTINPKLFTVAQIGTVSEGLNFSSGLRMETNCQNCGFNQVRMNGLEGTYSQILINGRPVFSGLAGVYGLELIPSNMIENIEVVRGGGSVLTGGNAIAGTINLRLKEPRTNTYEFGLSSALTGVGISHSGDPAPDHRVNFNTSLVSDDHKTGIAVFGNRRERDPFDANGDGFSEMTKLKNTTMGARLFQRLSSRNKLSVDFFQINEDRRGGNRFDYPEHLADIAESLTHSITTGAVTFDQYSRVNDHLSVYMAGQAVNRDSYYGAEQSLSGYGTTSDFTYNAGAQYKTQLHNSDIISGFDNTGGRLTDTKLGYPYPEEGISGNDSAVLIGHTMNSVNAKQATNTTGIFSQVEAVFQKLRITAGGRLDYYTVKDLAFSNDDLSRFVFVPKIGFLYDFNGFTQARLSYARGYRAPQIYDEDLHLEASGLRTVIHKNAPGLRQETSNSLMASVDYSKSFRNLNMGLLIEAFYTMLSDPFVYEYGEINENDEVVYTRINAAEGAVVQGINAELNVIPSGDFSFSSGFTLQSSRYKEAQEFNENRFFRTPGSYGYFTADWQLAKNLDLSATGSYTGKMLVPYFGLQLEDPDAGELRMGQTFFELGSKIRYLIRFNGTKMEIYAGVKNIFNAYQSDFDRGIDRDPGYIYGPSLPRTLYFGLRIGNVLN
jgi:outer membrane receptor for ferrienterochelin and colicins